MKSRPEIPASWMRLILGDVTDYGKTVKTEPSQIPANAWMLELEDIEKDTSKLLQRLTFSQRLSKSTKNRFVAGDVLYGKLRPYLNKVLIADQDGYCTTEIIPIKPNVAIDGRYLFYWFRHPEFLDYVDSVSHGIQMPRLGTEAGLNAPLILAPLPEQHRIVAKLDSLFTRSRRAREALERVPGLCERYKQAVLAAAFRGDLTADWREEKQLSESAKDLLMSLLRE
jgi:type I restriction enzyme, S subunit